MPSTRESASVERATHILTAVLDAWDPIGVAPDWPLGEYDCFVPPLLSLLSTDPEPEAIRSWLTLRTLRHIEIVPDPADTLLVSRFIHMWWSRNKDSFPTGVIDSDPGRHLP